MRAGTRGMGASESTADPTGARALPASTLGLSGAAGGYRVWASPGCHVGGQAGTEKFLPALGLLCPGHVPLPRPGCCPTAARSMALPPGLAQWGVLDAAAFCLSPQAVTPSPAARSSLTWGSGRAGWCAPFTTVSAGAGVPTPHRERPSPAALCSSPVPTRQALGGPAAAGGAEAAAPRGVERRAHPAGAAGDGGRVPAHRAAPAALYPRLAPRAGSHRWAGTGGTVCPRHP